MRSIRTVGRKSRPLRRLLTPRQFKETYTNEFLADRPNATYVEIGVQTGESFRTIRAARKLGVDPSRHPAMRSLRPGEEFFEQSSDDFFADDAARVLRLGAVDVALVDGLHEFRQALRDVLNLERFMRPDGLIVIDDCNPTSRERAVDTFQPGSWNGDVWKVVALLRRERPDLRTITVNADQGIGLVTGFRGKTVRPDANTIDQYKELGYDLLERERQDILGMVKPARIQDLIRA
jgi:SAM-dependent methyltransferase